MGYFSEKDIEAKDQSYHGFEEQLLWRYEELKERYLAFLKMGAPVTGDDYFSFDDYRYAPPESFKTLKDVSRAMEIAKEALAEACDIDEDDEEEESILEVVLLPTWLQTAMAA